MMRIECEFVDGSKITVTPVLKYSHERRAMYVELTDEEMEALTVAHLIKGGCIMRAVEEGEGK